MVCKKPPMQSAGNVQKKFSPRTYQICAKIMFIIGICSILIGLIAIAAGGVLFLVLGGFCIWISRNWQRQANAPGSAAVPLKHKADSTPIASRHSLTKEDFDVAGVYYRLNAIEALRQENPQWMNLPAPGDKPITIYRYKFKLKPVQLIPEPENKHDPNAIKVVIAGQHLGYISSNETAHVHQILDTRDVVYISAWIRGGEEKTIYPNGSSKFNVHDYDASVRIAYK